MWGAELPPETLERLAHRLTSAGALVAASLSASFGRAVEVEPGELRQCPLADLVTPGSVTFPVSCGLPEPLLVVVPASLVTALADIALGGPGISTDRTPTELEQRMAVQAAMVGLAPALGALEEWGAVVDAEAGSPTLVEEPPADSGDVVAWPVQVTLPTEVADEVVVAIPAHNLRRRGAAVPTPAVDSTVAALQSVPLTVAVRLRSTPVSADDLRALAPGDVLRLDHAHLADLTAYVDNRAVFDGVLGRRGERVAVAITRVVDGETL